ncbi:glutaredoxin family protein [Candidatus Vondammii sp. HM_W22]|uniref:glutaredoxin family protein n=1 Tax=Candidatus Vondammii sp. HM_W22 TaxID=2687299 RepID=UPI001F12D864|nr:glutaredoxin family protein [Candidatus Vondammii sp. HM_W22]
MKKQQEQVTLHSTRQCSYCRQEKAFSKQRKIPFAEFDVERNRRAFTDFQRAGGRGVPLILIGKQTLNGFNPKQLEKALRQAGFNV